MAKVFFYNIPAYGHINPTLPLVSELVRRGETVIYYAMLPFKEVIEATGATFRAYEDFSPEVGKIMVAEVANRAANTFELGLILLKLSKVILPHLFKSIEEEAPDYIVYDFMAIWGAYIADVLPLPAIETLPMFPISLRAQVGSSFSSFVAALSKIVSSVPASLRYRYRSQSLFREYGVRHPKLLDIFTKYEDFTVAFTSRYFYADAEDFGQNLAFVGPSLNDRQESLDFALDFASGPLIYISLGTVFNLGTDFFQKCFEAFGGKPMRIVLSVGKSIAIDALHDIPENFVVRRYVPQLEVLKQADAFVTHGGMNSTSEAFYYGVPLVVCPQAGDQFTVAQRVAELEAGVTLDKRNLTAAKLVAAVEQVLSNELFGQNARKIGDSFREAGGYMRAADEVLDYTKRFRVRGNF